MRQWKNNECLFFHRPFPYWIAKRSQSFINENRVAASASKQKYKHPLAPSNPAERNVVIPESAHPKYRSPETLPAEVLQKRANKALLLHLQQDVLWEGTIIDKVDHSLIQHFIKLSQNGKYRNSRQMIVTSGKEAIRELIDKEIFPQHLLIENGKPIPDWIKKSKQTEVVLAESHVVDACSPGNDGYVGDFSLPPPPLKENLIANKQRLQRVLVLDNIDDPGVFGSILRTASSFSYDAIISTNHCADLYDYRVLRAARGAHFNPGTPLYTLKDEDGDDVYGMLNHIIARNNLRPLCYLQQDDASSLSGAIESTTHANLSSVTRKQGVTLSEFCLSQFTSPPESSSKEEGVILFAGSNYKQNTLKRLTCKIQRTPTQLLLDEIPETNLLVGLSVVLFSLRPTGEWDYLPLDKQSEPSSLHLQIKKGSVDIGANRLSVSERDINMTEEDQIEEAHLQGEFKKWRRLQRRKKSDYDLWMEYQSQRIKKLQKIEQSTLRSPWSSSKPPSVTDSSSLPNWVPDIINDYRMPIDRDVLREEQEKSESYVRPNNYD